MFNAKQKKFPSSIGELHFSMEPQGLLAQLVEQFPSPIGELHFSIMCCDYSINYQTRFRPLSGNYISQLNRATLTGFVTEFPSPVGELHFSILISYAYECNIRCFRPLSGNYISQYHPYNPATSLGSWSGLRGKNIFGKINKIHSLKSAANSVFKPCAAKSKQIFSFIKKYQFHIVPSYILFPDSGYISKYVVKPSFLYLYNVYDLVAHLFCQRYLLLFQYLLFHQT